MGLPLASVCSGKLGAYSVFDAVAVIVGDGMDVMLLHEAKTKRAEASAVVPRPFINAEKRVISFIVVKIPLTVRPYPIPICFK